jgi:hypothetical protein
VQDAVGNFAWGSKALSIFAGLALVPMRRVVWERFAAIFPVSDSQGESFCALEVLDKRPD